MSTLVIVEHDHHRLKPSTASSVRAALLLGAPVTLALAGGNDGLAREAASIEGIEAVIHSQDPCFDALLAEDVSSWLVHLCRKHGFHSIVGPSNTFGKNILPRVAALLDVMQLSDVLRIEDSKTFVRPIYAGNALMRVQSCDPILVMTVRMTAFDAMPSAQTQAPIVKAEPFTRPQASAALRYVGHEQPVSERPDLQQARVVISGGRALGSAENFKLLDALARVLDAAVGGSRAAVDAGYLPNEYQIGQTGKVVAPELYIAVGISGAIQHLAGMKDSKVIVAINKDPNAPIFQVADYGLVGDLFDIIPELTEHLKRP